MSPNSFQYKPRAADAWQKRADQSGSQFDSYVRDEYKSYTLRKGENFIRILPPTWENPAHYGYDVWVHYSVGPNQGTVLCLHKMKNQKCSICEAQAKAELAGREDAKELKPSRRVLVWMLDRKEETVPLLWAMPWTVDRDISKICRDRQSGELYQIDHPEAGFDLSFDKEGEKMQTKYTGFQLARRHSSVSDAHLKYIDDNPVPETLLWRNYDEVKALFEGEVAPPTTSVSHSVSQESSQQKTEVAKQKVTPIKTSVIEQQLCQKPQISIKGVKYACGLEDLHNGDCDFSIEVPGGEVLTLTPQEYCPTTVVIRGVTYGCGIIGTHKGDHDFTREVTNGKSAVKEPPKEEVTEVTTPASRGSARTAAMKTRFQTGTTS